MKELSIYIHAPFCKSKCNYCSFYSIPLSKLKPVNGWAELEQYPEFLIKEINLEAEKYSLGGSRVNSIYFGGGTPSIMPAGFFSGLINHIRENFEIAEGAEITAEINPESGNLEKLSALKTLGINRLSIGAQSFDVGVLKTAGRIHNKNDIYNAADNAKKAGFKNISLDLIIGLPGQTKDIFYNDAKSILGLEPAHISAYMLSVEKGTKFYEIRKKGEINGTAFTPEEYIAEYYEILCGLLAENGYKRYEISNFAKNGYESRHNLNYWKRGGYLGLGPSASSFLKLENGKELRKTNTADLEKYIRNISKKFYGRENDNSGVIQNNGNFIEILTEKDKINEEIFLSLRTASGINAKRLSELAGREIIDKFIKEGFMQNSKENIILTLKGVLLSSEIFARIMI
ncbi:MAG: radical SAM family heme chaperone HemW [Deltaproteobacteria bacterium]|jgi:oxygen-independent coproporphyrinogen-3 oxidase|nr:radical SAM family heme chaperone HemW [Deltaproteobacteria bacterium]